VKKLIPVSLLLIGLTGSSQAALWVDFNSNQDGGGNSNTAGDPGLSAAAHNNQGWNSYHANHETVAEFAPATYATSFSITGAGNVTVTPAWPNTSDRRVQQSIDRGAGFDNNWNDNDLNLVTDFIGIDTRTNNGGFGNWDGTNGTPTLMTLTLDGLAAGSYNWTSYHHDTEHVHGTFRVQIDTGTGLSQLADGVMTDSSPGGNPNSAVTVSDFAGMTAQGSIYNTSFTADGVNSVVLEFAPYANTAVHAQIWGMNGFQLTQVPEPSSSLLGLLGALFVLRRRR